MVDWEMRIWSVLCAIGFSLWFLMSLGRGAITVRRTFRREREPAAFFLALGMVGAAAIMGVIQAIFGVF